MSNEAPMLDPEPPKKEAARPGPLPDTWLDRNGRLIDKHGKPIGVTEEWKDPNSQAQE